MRKEELGVLSCDSQYTFHTACYCTLFATTHSCFADTGKKTTLSMMALLARTWCVPSEMEIFARDTIPFLFWILCSAEQKTALEYTDLFIWLFFWYLDRILKGTGEMSTCRSSQKNSVEPSVGPLPDSLSLCLLSHHDVPAQFA